MIKMMLKSACLLATLVTTCALADNKTPHTWHTVRAENGTWDAKLQMLNQGGSFVTRDGVSLNNFTINPAKTLDYGFIFYDGADFDVAYTLTMIERNSDNLRFQSKTCVYLITASGPAKPDIRVSSFNGAKCDYRVVHGKGEDFMVS